MVKAELENRIKSLAQLLEHWGLKISDWIVMDKFLSKEYLEDLSYNEEIHIAIPIAKLPWKMQIKLKNNQTIPPIESSYFKEYLSFISQKLFLEIRAVENSVYLEFLRLAEKISLVNGCTILQLQPLYHVLKLDNMMTEAARTKKNTNYEHLLELEKRLLKYATKVDDQKILKVFKENEAVRLNSRSKNLEGQLVNNISVDGKVKLIFQIKNGLTINEDEIMVCDYTDINWLPFMVKAKGIIAQQGGLSSHTAIVCRELNKPCIINVANVLFELRDNDLVRIDAPTSRVIIINPENKF